MMVLHGLVEVVYMSFASILIQVWQLIIAKHRQQQEDIQTSQTDDHSLLLDRR